MDLLFKNCDICGREQKHTKMICGTLVTVNTTCNCGHFYSGQSQPLSGTMPIGNLILSAAILFSGISPMKSLNMCNHAGIEIFSLRTYNNIQSAYLVPAVESVWQVNQLELLQAAKESN